MLIRKKNGRFGSGVKAAGIAAALLLGVSACATGGGDDSGDGGGEGGAEGGALRIGTLLPQTGALAFLGPPEIAGVDLAIQEINETGGVNGEDVDVLHRDSGDTTTDLASQSTTDLLNEGVAAIIGAASSGVSQTVINQITGAGVLQISPANTSPEFSTWDDDGFYWRTAPSDVLQGRVLGNYIVSEGHQTVGMIVLNDAYGTGLAESITEAVEGAGGEIVAESLFNEGDSQFTSQVDEVVAADPDAVVLISFDQATSIIPLLTARGVEPTNLFMVDGNTADYSGDLDPGTLEGASGSQPGAFADGEMQERLLEIDPDLDSFSYAAESYDAAALVALAAIKAGSTDPAAIRDEMQGISSGGQQCFLFTECRELLDADPDADIDYEGYSGPIEFSDVGDVTAATIGIYVYDGDNVPHPEFEEFGEL